jgi:nicotinate phosphoribosyltransferase
MANGKRVIPPRSLPEIANFSLNRLANLPEEYKRFDNPHIYKIGISKNLENERNRLIQEFKR